MDSGSETLSAVGYGLLGQLLRTPIIWSFPTFPMPIVITEFGLTQDKIKIVSFCLEMIFQILIIGRSW